MIAPALLRKRAADAAARAMPAQPAAKKRAAAGDTAGLAAQLAKLPHRDLLSPEDQAWVDSALGRGAVAAKP